jgi:BRCA1-associated protein
MDETTGLLIILCQHVFHCQCLEKWKGTGCPVCRYTQSSYALGPSSLARASAEGADAQNACSVCGAEQNVWICLICGNVGCGRYDSAHAFAHWEETHHSFAMDVSTQHVWDYAGDGYVHRLIQNKGDGKLMDLPGVGKLPGQQLEAFGADMVPREKMEAMGNEYTYLLTSQLEGQRLYFEEQLDRAVDKSKTAQQKADSAYNLAERTAGKLKEVTEMLMSEKTNSTSLNKEVTRLKTRADKAEVLARKVTGDWKEEKVVNESLLERIKFIESKLAEATLVQRKLEDEKKDLEEQNRDLMFNIMGQEKVKTMAEEMGEEVVEGKMAVGAVPDKDKGKKKKRK